MNKQLTLSASLALILLTASAVVSQRPTAPAQPTPTPSAAAPSAAGPLPVSKMAIVYSDGFLDPKTGIAKFTALLTKLNGEFQAPKNELAGLQTRAQTLQDELTKLQQAPAGTPIDNRSIQS